MYRGVVIDNADPQRIGRCIVTVPGVLPEDGGPWAIPIGGMGAGSAQHGIYAVPNVGADVAVWFEQGDPDHPFYMGGNPGTTEVPGEVSDSENSDEQATKVAVWETDRWRLKMDGRVGKGEFHIIDKVTGDAFEIDGVNCAVRIKGTAVVQIESPVAVNIDAPNITIGGRTIVKNGKPVQ